MYRFAQIIALIAASVLLLQPVWAARWPFIERLMGLDRLMRFHKWTGIVSYSLILVHGGIMLWYFRTSLTFIFSWSWYILGPVALGIMTAIVLVTVLRQRLHLPYHWWKRIHQVMYLALLSGFLHSFFVGSDLTQGPLRYYWIGLGSLAVISLLYRHIVIPITTKRYVVQTHQVIAGSVHHTTLAPVVGKKLNHNPGQFMMIQFRVAGITREWHPFTISSAPSDPALTVSMKESGDWTATLGNLKPNTPTRVEGPYGRFSYQCVPADTRGYVFLAGGIGITPLRSMIRELCANNDTRPLTLLYNARTLQDFAFKDELDALARQYTNLKLVYITSQEKSSGRFGRIDAQCIQDEINDISTQHYFICGPKPMMAAVRTTLRTLGVAKSRLHTEEFSLT